MKKTISALLILLCAAMLTGCAGMSVRVDIKPAELVNTQEFDADGVDSITVSYISDDVTLLESDSDKIVLKEYMSENKESFYAKTAQKGNELKIESGDRPKISVWNSYVELYLPVSYIEKLELGTVSGSIETQLALTCKDFTVSNTSGLITLDDLTADSIELDTVSGSIECSQLYGDTSIASTSGSIAIDDLFSEAEIANVSGSIEINCAQDLEKLEVESVSGSIDLTVPKELSFEFSAESDSGTISTPFSDSSDKSSVSVDVGSDPTAEIELSTLSGSINVMQ
jgi:DUF4097 and DUF4098 domain-containing protein YvlB